MFYMGVLDILCLWVCGIAAGLFGMLGVVYCSCPTLNYVLGALGLGEWVVSGWEINKLFYF
jgi:hypothetical protein